MKKCLILVCVPAVFSWNLATVAAVAVDPSQKPPLSAMGYAIGGPNDIVANSQNCIISVYQNLSRELHVDFADHLSLEKIKSKLHEMLGDKRISFKLTLKPNGKIAALEILKSSGSEKLDQQFKELIVSASPFAANPNPEDLTWLLEFPELNLQPSSSMFSSIMRYSSVSLDRKVATV